MITYLVQKIETCSECGGQGHTYDPRCRVCGWRVTEKEIAHLDHNDNLLCGHPIRDLEEEPICCECEGAGKIESWVDLKDALQELEP